MVEFRKDIQSLRGLSALLVFIYHYNKKIFPSGFVGVDIFFYISGFIITLSYITKYKSNSFVLSFYLKRIKRLIPVAHLTLFISILLINKFSILYQNKLYLDIIYSLFSVSNYRFIYLSYDYLSQNDKASIVLHFWSLSVEDQFYILYPLLLPILHNNTMLIIILFIISLIYSSYINFKYHYIAYFSFISRIWQILFGVISVIHYKVSKYGYMKDYLIIIIIFFCCYIKIELYFPSPLSIIPLILIHLIISNQNSSMIMDINSLIELGEISYSFYLIHYIVIYLFTKTNHTIFNFIMIFCFTLVISYNAYILFENPIRKSNRTYLVTIILFCSFIILFFSCIYLININNAMRLKNKNNISTDYNKIYNSCKKYCHIKSASILYSPDELKNAWKNSNSLYYICPFSNIKLIANINRNKIILLLTDSHGYQWFNTIIPYAKEMNYVTIYIWFWEDTIIKRKYNNIYKIFNIISKVEYIVSAHYLSYKSNNSLFRTKYFLYLEILLNYTTEIYVIHDTPHFEKNPNLCLIKTSNYESCYSIIGLNATYYKFPIYPNIRIHYIDMINFICLNSIKCYYIWNTIPIYLDTHHLSLQFTEILSKKLLIHLQFIKQNCSVNINKNYFFTCKYSSI